MPSIREEYLYRVRAKYPDHARPRRAQRVALRLARRGAAGDLNAWIDLLVHSVRKGKKVRLPKWARTHIAELPFSRIHTLADEELNRLVAAPGTSATDSLNRTTSMIELTRRAAIRARSLTDREIWRLVATNNAPFYDLAGSYLEWERRFSDHSKRGTLLTHYLNRFIETDPPLAAQCPVGVSGAAATGEILVSAA